ncbi:uroporphyrinogen decarboxylase family protein [Afifella sp. IM 167]|uniref:uroporphyrinogen decarboxylase family protein n=1 Tax=Afifella sp. IM 167 TaxID=2033586 RepID=UPI001CC97476|nr:5-methyltetrahydropteroyltriglutamate--homocysteine methyltransferase [Afifella sp. IM 167]
MSRKPLETTVVGSYPQPAWLIDPEKLKAGVPRVRAPFIWRVPAELLSEAQDDAARLAIADMERAGIDVVTDGEVRRESYSNHFANALEGLDEENPGEVISRIGKPIKVPRVVAPVRRARPVGLEALKFLRAQTDRKVKVTLPGPFTLAQQAQNDFYASVEEMALAYADAVNEEARELADAGADIIQLDEPWMQAFPDRAGEYAVKAIDRALKGVNATTVVHLCFGYAAFVADKPAGYSFLPQLADCSAEMVSIEAAQPRLDPGILAELSGKSILYGVIDLGTEEVESPETVAERIRPALKFVSAERLLPAPDCGMKYLPRAVAFAKLKALADGAAIVRAEL